MSVARCLCGVGGLWGIPGQRALEKTGLQKSELYFPGFEQTDLDAGLGKPCFPWVRCSVGYVPVEKGFLGQKKFGKYCIF